MAVAVADARSTGTDALAYTTSAEHTQDELQRLDLVIQLQLLKQRHDSAPDPLNSFRGLVLSDEAIDSLVASGPDCTDSPRLECGTDPRANELRAALHRLELTIQQRCAASKRERRFLALPRLAELFHLTPFEMSCVVVSLAPELDRKYEKLYAYLQDDITRKKPCVDLVQTLFCGSRAERWSAREAFDFRAPLIKYRLLQMAHPAAEVQAPLLARTLKLDDRIVDFLMELDTPDMRLAEVVLPPVWDDMNVATVAPQAAQYLRMTLEDQLGNPEIARRPMVVYLYGPSGSGKERLAERWCSELGYPLLRADVNRMLARGTAFDECAWLLGRETLLQPTALCLKGFDALLTEGDGQATRLAALLDVLQEMPRLTFLIGKRAWRPQGLLRNALFLELEFPLPDEVASRALWRQCLRVQPNLADDVDADALAGKFRLTAGQIQEACVAAGDQVRWRSPGHGPVTLADLTASCRERSQHHLDRLARKVQTRYGWKDITLPEDRLRQLKEISQSVTYRAVVYGDWGFDRKLSRGKGLSVLFAGPSGTGKTMAAEILAGELGLDLYKIDLSTVVSKYIGETEKNLSRIFAEAEASNAILFFDEADALFGKRSEVKDAHDRYANVEVGYLLQKMEEYEGVVILATNLRKNLDEAFARRLQYTVEFPFPTEADRRRIWDGVWPIETPRAPSLDLDFLARRFEMSGGNIRNVAVAAAFLAAADGSAVTMAQVLHATRREYQKMGKVVREGEFTDHVGATARSV